MMRVKRLLCEIGADQIFRKHGDARAFERALTNRADRAEPDDARELVRLAALAVAKIREERELGGRVEERVVFRVLGFRERRAFEERRSRRRTRSSLRGDAIASSFASEKRVEVIAQSTSAVRTRMRRSDPDPK